MDETKQTITYAEPFSEGKDNTLLNGAKLSEEDAKHFFPDIELPYRH
ncbi:hypothetical protein LCGC14_0386290 [marine sediment metagenome]|uniref:Uncharacterized protein n=1 Tax=marine sediment metagenome TaxID=412755 RepID=A0A0F9T0V8_9ZZZZ